MLKVNIQKIVSRSAVNMQPNIEKLDLPQKADTALCVDFLGVPLVKGDTVAVSSKPGGLALAKISEIEFSDYAFNLSEHIDLDKCDPEDLLRIENSADFITFDFSEYGKYGYYWNLEYVFKIKVKFVHSNGKTGSSFTIQGNSSTHSLCDNRLIKVA